MYMGIWRNGKRDSLKSCFPQGSGGSSPSIPTKFFLPLESYMKFYYCAMAAGIFIIEGSKILTNVLQHIWIVETNAKTI